MGVERVQKIQKELEKFSETECFQSENGMMSERKISEYLYFMPTAGHYSGARTAVLAEKAEHRAVRLGNAWFP